MLYKTTTSDHPVICEQLTIIFDDSKYVHHFTDLREISRKAQTVNSYLLKLLSQLHHFCVWAQQQAIGKVEHEVDEWTHDGIVFHELLEIKSI